MLPTPPPSPLSSTGQCRPADDDDDPQLGTILAGRIELTDVLGVGAYGTVYRARDIETGTPYAVKALNKRRRDRRQRRFQDREILLHHRARRHPHVVSLDRIWDTPDCTFVVLEYCPEGDLFAKITDEGDYVGNDHKARTVFGQILDAVRHCHAHGVYHRDLKPENILVADHGWTVKLADFGLATADPVSADFGCGSTFYMSPECHQPTNTTTPPHHHHHHYYASAPNDVWSLGVILVNLICGRNPWKRACAADDATFRAYLHDRNFLQTILPISEPVNALLQRIFDPDPSTRISVAELRECMARCPPLRRREKDVTPRLSPVVAPVDPAPPRDENPRRPSPPLESVPHLDPLPLQLFSRAPGQQQQQQQQQQQHARAQSRSPPPSSPSPHIALPGPRPSQPVLYTAFPPRHQQQQQQMIPPSLLLPPHVLPSGLGRFFIPTMPPSSSPPSPSPSRCSSALVPHLATHAFLRNLSPVF